jgi:PncC family amidohydrolase
MNAAEKLLEQCRAARIVLCTAESCTGGLIGAALTDIPGSSDIFMQGFITYSNEAKRHVLNVSDESLSRHGAVSQQVAEEMAVGGAYATILPSPDYDALCVSVTGIAGPGGGSSEKPVGTVHLAVASAESGLQLHEEHHFSGTRQEIRAHSVDTAIAMLSKIVT